MKLYFHPVSTSCRPVLALFDEARIAHDAQLVDLVTGEHHKEPFISLNPNRVVPVIDDDGFVLTESATILKYAADKAESPFYPKERRARARVDERMDWFNTGFYRDWGYNLIYPQLYPHHKRQSEEITNATIEWGLAKSRSNLALLDTVYLRDREWIAGDSITIADLFGGSIVAAGKVIGASFAAYPNIAAWLGRLEARPSWRKASEGLDAFAASVRGKEFVVP